MEIPTLIVEFYPEYRDSRYLDIYIYMYIIYTYIYIYIIDIKIVDSRILPGEWVETVSLSNDYQAIKITKVRIKILLYWLLDALSWQSWVSYSKGQYFCLKCHYSDLEIVSLYTQNITTQKCLSDVWDPVIWTLEKHKDED